MMKVEVCTRETIKPSYPTPPHLRTHHLSWLDQLAPPSHVPIIVFFPVADYLSAAETLKKSLSQTLTLFPLLAGRLNPNSAVVECNDAGADLIVSRADSPISRFLAQRRDPDLESLSLLLPCDRSCSTWGATLLAVNLTLFPCGGAAVSLCAAHKIADGLSLAAFVSSWSAAARSAAAPIPDFSAAALFPPSNTASLLPSPINPAATKTVSTRRFLFEPSKLSLLRGPKSVTTRVEAVAALIWRCAMRARSVQRVSVAAVVVGLRQRTDPPMPDSAFGNLSTVTAAADEEGGDEGAKERLEGKLRAGIGKIDKQWAERLQGPEGPMLALEPAREAGRQYGKTDEDMFDVDVYYMNSWVRFPVYEADFGWGKPARVATARFFWKNMVLLMGRGDGGMEAWVTLDEDEMERFELDQELCSYVTPEPVIGGM